MTEDAYLQKAITLHAERDRLAGDSSEWDTRAFLSGTPADAGSARRTRSDLEIVRELCRRHLYENVPVTLQQRILRRLREAGYTPEPEQGTAARTL